MSDQMISVLPGEYLIVGTPTGETIEQVEWISLTGIGLINGLKFDRFGNSDESMTEYGYYLRAPSSDHERQKVQDETDRIRIAKALAHCHFESLPVAVLRRIEHLVEPLPS